jgi:hypothetical protein
MMEIRKNIFILNNNNNKIYDLYVNLLLLCFCLDLNE